MYCTIPPILRSTPHARFDFLFSWFVFDGRTANAYDYWAGASCALLLRLNALALTLEGTVVLAVDVVRVWLCSGTPTNVSAQLRLVATSLGCIWAGLLSGVGCS